MSDQTLSTVADDLRDLLEAAPPAIALSFEDTTTADEIERCFAAGLDVAELRIDRYASFETSHVLAHVERFAGRPTIATIRDEREGGKWRGTDEQRLDLFRHVLPKVAAVDVELSSEAIRADVVESARALNKVVIVSNHNFDSTPTVDQLLEMATEAKRIGADFVKLSAMTHSPGDVRALAEFTLANADLGLIVIAMGDFGSVSRVFFPALGSRLTYAYRAHPVAGQLDYEDTFSLLRKFYPDFSSRKAS
jgi:3-dehydroquinate dehydratase-1